MSEVDNYIENVDKKWKDSFISLKKVIDEHIPSGFQLEMQYGMPSYVVPLATFPNGYHCKEDTPLPFISIAAQKKHIALYHMGIYADKELLDWFQKEYPKHMTTKLNMGKSCIRFTNRKKIPFELIGELVSKMSVEEWVDRYQAKL
ncbi:DUF1801 domain-containing protein [Gracilibacillus sp. YIM 98692]|uniref:DUF1801 domain-containing protein n=1 Tax=Gracilibacillus sp. YIM 98692 TaxID=2663532 RepID=UPI0013D36870|nr:DUF1801 domain-containing protein [Gracilibacillus sp. YIM 98692]